MRKWIRRYLVVVLGIAAAFVILVWIVSTVYYYASGEAAYLKAEKSKSSYYLFWYRGIDTVYTIGFDAQDKVTITESGGT